MVSIKIDAGKVCELEIVGDLDIITSEVAFAIGSEVTFAIGLIYEKMKKGNEEAAEGFRKSLESAFEDRFLFMSNKERDEFLGEKAKKMTRRELREAEKKAKEFFKRILGGDDD